MLKGRVCEAMVAVAHLTTSEPLGTGDHRAVGVLES
jgi:hypothetical protein